MVACIGIVILLLLYLWGDVFIGAFVDSKTQKKVIDVGVDYLRTVSVWYMLMGFMNVTNGVLRGSGDIRLFMDQAILWIALGLLGILGAAAYYTAGL